MCLHPPLLETHSTQKQNILNMKRKNRAPQTAWGRGTQTPQTPEPGGYPGQSFLPWAQNQWPRPSEMRHPEPSRGLVLKITHTRPLRRSESRTRPWAPASHPRAARLPLAWTDPEGRRGSDLRLHPDPVTWLSAKLNGLQMSIWLGKKSLNSEERKRSRKDFPGCPTNETER